MKLGKLLVGVLGAVSSMALPRWASAASPGLPAIQELQLSGIAEGPVGAAANETLGWSFTTNNPIQITALGFFDLGGDGLATSHRIGLWDTDGNLLVSATVQTGNGNTLVGQYRYVSIAPLTLQSHHTFVIGATVPMDAIVPADEMPHIFPYDAYPFYNVIPSSVQLSPQILQVSTDCVGQNSVEDLLSVSPPGELSYPMATPYPGFLLASNFLFSEVGGSDSPSVPEPGIPTTVATIVFLVSRRVRSWARTNHNGAVGP
jgi:hypothetical protein